MKKQYAHPFHIVTTKKTILNQVEDFAYDIDQGLVYCIMNRDKDNVDYDRILYSVCWRLHMIARLVYKGKDGIGKLPVKGYRKILFEGFTESIEDVAHIINKIGVETTDENMKRAYKCLRSMEELIAHPIANVYEMIYIHELANIIDYVIQKNGNILEPEYRYSASLFPSNYNYEDFSYSKPFGIEFDSLNIRKR